MWEVQYHSDLLFVRYQRGLLLTFWCQVYGEREIYVNEHKVEAFSPSPPCHSPRSLGSLSFLTFTHRRWHGVGTY